MYLAQLEIENFRLFGTRDSVKHCSLALNPGINLLVGENDSGKTCIIDAIRLLVGTATADYFAISDDDFHIANGERAQSLTITGTFRGLSTEEAGALLEWLSVEGTGEATTHFLKLRLNATRLAPSDHSPRRRRVQVDFRAGTDEQGTRFDSHARELLQATYLKPLRDAINELASKRGSRLSQVLRAFRDIAEHDRCDWDPAVPTAAPQTLVGISRKADHDIRQTAVIQNAEQHLNDHYLSKFSIGDSPLKGQISVSGQDLRQVLERLELSLSDATPGTTRGLGIYNLLFIAAELLALTPGTDPELPLLLIEEPEAHLHPQFQYRLVDFLCARAKKSPDDAATNIQFVVTSHSPNLASKIGLRYVTILHKGKPYSLHPNATKLANSDYEFLERFLDVTKASLFFARGILMVEGDAEALLLPAIAERIGCSLTQAGVSIVNVGHVGLFRYSRIFQRKDGIVMPVRVACLADRDIPPAEAKSYLANERKAENEYLAEEIEASRATKVKNDGGAVQTFVSEVWTLEYDLAFNGLAKEMHVAVSLARKSKKSGTFPSEEARFACIRNAIKEFNKWKSDNLTPAQIASAVFEPLYKKQASKAETAQALASLLSQKKTDLRDRLPPYLVSAIDYATGKQPANGTSSPT
ncbi:ATP-dependent nuclease [Lacunimicrobium album]